MFSSMRSVIERYAKLTEDNYHLINPTAEIKFWQREASSLRKQLQYLQQCRRQLLGKELSGLSVEDLQNLENQLEKSLKGVRTRKEQTMREEIKELHLKANLTQQENLELHKKIHIVSQENAELQKRNKPDVVNLG
ncbi:MADS-box transcription factor 27-like, partial [Salvia hispanica]|uniref:MADS-box transcription factor 27-like n=1 Tax=Salvia hispanica TaxID=49212 RepID=UPI0020091552